MTTRINGECLCGSVSFSTKATDHVDACHCNMCRKWGGSAFMGVDVRDGDVVFKADDTLTWFDSSDWAKRGFCGKCGSNLFYRLKELPDFWAISAGTLELPASTELSKEIFIEEKPAFYDLSGTHPKLTGEAFMAGMQAEVGGYE